MVTGQQITLTKYEYAGADLTSKSYLETKVTCYTQNGFLLWNADVSSYATQGLGHYTYILIGVLFIGVAIGIMLRKIASG